MKKLFFCISLVLTGLMSACVEKNEAVDADSKPSWLGESIYQELKNPQHLEGTFNTYLRLIDDLGYAETLNRTGSMTVFPANDEAFKRFFASNDWGVSSYEQLTTAQRNLLLKNSMLSNALLVGMLSNASAGTDAVSKGASMKHQTSQNVIDTIQHIMPAEMPANNRFWDDYRTKTNMYVVSDATQPMMVHFTREHMLSNGITTAGENSDFAILTGSEYQDGMAYIFGYKIINSDVTCQNGYIHQMEDVIVPPGNMAQVLRADDETSLFSRIIDYFSVPFENKEVTDAYNSWASEQTKAGKNVPVIDQIYEVRYLNNDGNHRQNRDANGQGVDYLLKFDPGWNQYSPLAASNGIEMNLKDVGVIFTPTNQAMIDFFTEGGNGAYLINLYGIHTGAANNAANLAENLDSLYSKRPAILTDFANNLMKKEFTTTVPSHFETIPNDVNEFMGITVDMLHKKNDGKYDIKVANNGVIYKMDQLLPPDRYQSVMAPSSVYPDMKVMDWAITDDDQLGVSFHYYLMAMKAKYAFFIPDDEAFEHYYIDPIYLGHEQPRALKFSYRQTTATSGTVQCVAYEYDPATNTIGNVMNGGALVNTSQWKSLFIDLLNYHTIVLDSTEVFGANNYYKTKHGGEVRVDGTTVGGKIMSGQQIDNGIEPSVIEEVYHEKNGTAFRVNHVIEAPRNSVYATLRGYDKFSEFYALCNGFDEQLLTWAGISPSRDNDFGISEQDAYIMFTSNRRVSKDETINSCCLDVNVKMFNTYNYTLYAPNNDAMEKAYAAGLPKWSQIRELYDNYSDETDEDVLAQKKSDAKKMIDKIRDFARYHFQSVSVYADNNVEARKYNSLSTNEKGIAEELEVTSDSGNGRLYIKDGAGHVRVIDANDTSKKCNLMARDYWFDATRTRATSIYTSSFCVIHELSEPLYAK